MAVFLQPTTVFDRPTMVTTTSVGVLSYTIHPNSRGLSSMSGLARRQLDALFPCRSWSRVGIAVRVPTLMKTLSPTSTRVPLSFCHVPRDELATGSTAKDQGFIPFRLSHGFLPWLPPCVATDHLNHSTVKF
jgi:hypothetical protein